MIFVHDPAPPDVNKGFERDGRSQACAQANTRDRQHPQRECGINSRCHGNRAAQQKAASSGGWEGCCGGFNEKVLKKKKKVTFFFFFGEGAKWGEQRRTAARRGSTNPHTSATKAGEDRGMCATCKEFLLFARSFFTFRFCSNWSFLNPTRSYIIWNKEQPSWGTQMMRQMAFVWF